MIKKLENKPCLFLQNNQLKQQHNNLKNAILCITFWFMFAANSLKGDIVYIY